MIRALKAVRVNTRRFMAVLASAPIRRVPGVAHLQALLKRSDMVREGRLELPLCRQSWILSPVRLPIPPLSQLPYSTRINGQINMSSKACQGVSGGLVAGSWMLDTGSWVPGCTSWKSKSLSGSGFRRIGRHSPAGPVQIPRRSQCRRKHHPSSNQLYPTP